MKITEITEGYANTDEGFADAWSTVKKAGSAVGRGVQAVDRATTGGFGAAAAGATGRSAMRGLRGVGAKMGSGKAQGQLKMDKALMGVMKNYQRYLGQANLDQNYGSLQNYLKALGIQNPIMRENFAPGADPVNGQKAVSTELSRNQVADIIRKNLEAAMKSGTLPKEIQKFLSS